MDKQRLRAFLIGGAAGLLAGVIFAPRSGRELRGSIADRAGEARERSRETLFEAQERLQERRAAAREGPRRRSEERLDEADEAPGLGMPGLAPVQDTAPQRPRLREVPRDAAGDAGGDPAEELLGEGAGGYPDAERSDELRRKVRETRARLRERLDGPGGSGSGSEDHDPGPAR